MDLENKKLASPYYPQDYSYNTDGCEWLITAPEKHIISFEEVKSLNVSKKQKCYVDLHSVQYDIFYSKSYVILFDGACDQTKELKYGTMSDDGKWITFGSGSYIFVTLVIADVYDVYDYSTTLLAKINYGKEILNRHYYYSFYNCEHVYIKGG